MAVVTTKRIHEHRVFVQIRGELDALTLDELQATLSEVVRTADVTIDLSRAAFQDDGPVQMLLTCRERANASGHNLRVLNGPREVQTQLQLPDRFHYRRGGKPVKRDVPAEPVLPTATTADKERSRADSEQILRLQCELCGHPTFRPEGTPIENCPECAGPLKPVAIFRDRRRVQMPVEEDRRQDN